LLAEDLGELGEKLLELGEQELVVLALRLLDLLLLLLLAFVARVGLARESHRADDDALDSRRDLERVVLHVLARATEDRVKELLLRRELALRLRNDLPHEDVALLDVRPDPHDARLIEVLEHAFGDVRDLAGELLATELRLANLDLELVDVDRRVDVVLDEALADDDGILEVVAIPAHERDEDVASESELAVVRGRSVRDDLPLLDLLALLDDRPLVEAGAFVEALELAEMVDVVADLDALRVDVGD